MPQFIQKYTIVQFFDKIQDGYEYDSSSWPLHSTVVDTFAIDWSLEEMTAKVADVLSQHTPVVSQVKDDMFFGENGQVQVTLLEKTDELARLHADIVAVLEQGGLTLNDPQFAGAGFLPHATVQKHARLVSGDAVRFSALSIIDMFPDEDAYRRKVRKTLTLG